MKKKITAIIITSLLLVTLGGATVLAAGNSRQRDQWQENQGQDGSTCICGGAHTFTDQDGDGVCDYRDSASGYQGGTGQYRTDGNCDGSGQYVAHGHHADFGHHSTGSGRHHREYNCR